MYHKGAIEDSALQVYASALLFSPKKSIIRNLFKHEEPDNITINPSMNDSWSACLQTLEGHRSWVHSVAFSHDSARLASASWDDTVKIWDAHSGVCLQTLKGHRDSVYSVAFSHDSARLASASRDKTVKIWDAHSGVCLQTLKGHGSSDLAQILASQYPNKAIDEARKPVCQNIHISDDGVWIFLNAQKLLWLPTEYRPGCTAISGEHVGIGTGHGKVWIGRFQ